VTGTSFVPGAVVMFNRIARVTTFVSSTEVDAQLLTADLSSAGTPEILVQNPSPLGGISNPLTFTVGYAVPTLTSVSPNSLFAGAADTTVTLTGANFVPLQQVGSQIITSQVMINGVTSSTGFQVRSSTQIDLILPSHRLQQLGALQIAVVNPSPGGGQSGSRSVDLIASDTARESVVVSILPDGTTPNRGSRDVVASSDARYAAFSYGLSISFGGYYNVGIRDTCIGQAGCTPSTTVAARPVNLFENREQLSASADARYVAFVDSLNGVPDDPNILVFDSCIGAFPGCTPAVLLESPKADGSPMNVVERVRPVLSASGRYVAFAAEDGLPAPAGYVSNYGVFLRDTCLGASAGCSASTNEVSVDSSGVVVPSSQQAFAMSADARYVAFTGEPMLGTYPLYLLFLRDTCTGASACTPSTTALGTTRGFPMSLSSTGRFLAYTDSGKIMLLDLCIGAAPGCVSTAVQVDVADDGTPSDGGSGSAQISSDGRYVAFLSNATNLAPNDTNKYTDAFIRDTCTGAAAPCSGHTARLSLSSSGVQTGAGAVTWISPDGNWIGYVGVGGDGNPESLLVKRPF
jgi:hypothetical protein